MTNQQAMRLSAILGDGEAFYKAPVDGQLVDLGLISVEPDEITVRPISFSGVNIVGIDYAKPGADLTVFSESPGLDKLIAATEETHCPTCGALVESIFDHVDIDCG